MAIFGSFAKGKSEAKSDVDIFVEFIKPRADHFFGLLDYLEKKLRRDVDLLTPGALQSMRVKMIVEDIKRSLVNV